MTSLKRNIQEIYGSNGNGTMNGSNGSNGAVSGDNGLSGAGGPMAASNGSSANGSADPNVNQDIKKSRLDNTQLNKQQPSRVVHLRNIPNQLSEHEVIYLGLSFGLIKNVLFLRSKNQAFLEFDALNHAQQMIDHFANTSATFSGKKIFVQYSNHQELQTDPNNASNLSAQAALQEAVELHRVAKQGGKNTVLRVTVLNMIYPVTLDVLNQIFSKFGQILKMITFNKNDKFQALVQMKDAQSALAAKQSLHGQNIYNGCCTLQIDYSKLTTLEVRWNNDKSRDFTNLLLPSGDGHSQGGNISLDSGMHGNSQSNMSMSASMHSLNGQSGGGHQMGMNQYQQQSLIGQPPGLFNNNNPGGGFGQPGLVNQLQSNSYNQMSLMHAHHGQGPMGMSQGHHQQHHHQQQHQSQSNQSQGGGGSNITTPVLLVSNLNEEFVTTDALFTLFGVYGDVLRVKILFNKKDSALINFTNAQQAATALSNLDRIKLWGKQIRVFASKHVTVQMPKEGQPDSGLTKDFSNSPLHRFKKPGSKNFNNIFPPSPTLHLSNIPQNVSEQQLRDLFSQYGQVKGFKFFAKDRKMALVQLSSAEEASQALIATHNYQLADNMHLRCTFSKATV